MATLYLIEQGAEIGYDGERIVVRRAGEMIGSVPLVKVDDIVILAPSASAH